MITILAGDTLVIGLTAANLERLPLKDITFTLPIGMTKIDSFVIVAASDKVAVLDKLKAAGMEIGPYYYEEARKDPL